MECVQEEMAKLGRLVELTVVELTSADCIWFRPCQDFAKYFDSNDQKEQIIQ